MWYNETVPGLRRPQFWLLGDLKTTVLRWVILTLTLVYILRAHFDISLILVESLDDSDMQPRKYDYDQLFSELIISHIWQNFYLTRSSSFFYSFTFV